MNRNKEVEQVILNVMILNVLIAIVKLALGFATGALSVIADGFHSIIDSTSNLIGLIALRISSQPPDADHPYGHRKYESVATFAIGGLLLLVSWEIGKGIFERLFSPHAAPHIALLDIALMSGTFLVNLGVVVYETLRGRALKSDFLIADAAHTRTDIYVTVSVVVSLVATWLGFGWVDLIVATAVVLLIVYAAYDILKRTAYVLTDATVVQPNLLETTAASVKGVQFVHKARSRGSAEAAYVDLHVKVDPAMSTTEAHAIASEVERKIKTDVAGVVDAVIHIEPAINPNPNKWEALKVRVRAEADAMGIGIHDLHVHEEKTGDYHVELHTEVPANLSLGEAHALADELESRIQAAIPQVGEVTSHIEPLPEGVPDEEGHADESYERLQARITKRTNSITGRGSAHSVKVHQVDGQLTATVHITLPAGEPLVRAHALAGEVERKLLTGLPRLKRIVVHVEPPE
jgi:cation diffusion facilitator family transporter